ncbi:9432_t:CDS:2 [Dentiscutata heterogama]|uniref:9432_t:CDS:1 n=1 Tax=Dentiscutata heterogama TaxID=1316150 RepID=A0ACA9KEN7_9GLOM|nr:9432_t:CDS:2 [Dentiscutata heterogama]
MSSFQLEKLYDYTEFLQAEDKSKWILSSNTKKAEKRSNIVCLIRQGSSQNNYSTEKLKDKKVHNLLFAKEKILQKSNEEKICINIAETSKPGHIVLLVYMMMASIVKNI